jgi:uncharacterized protein
MPDGSTAILMENAPIILRTAHEPNVPPQEWRLDDYVNLDTTPGGGSAEQRVREMDQDGVDAEILFPPGELFRLDAVPDDDAYLAIVRGFNEWLAEEYCAVARDRLFGMGLIPKRGIDHAMQELEHCAKLGFKGVVLAAYPNGKGRPMPEDDRFWAAALDACMPVATHEGVHNDSGDYLANRFSVPVGRRSHAVTALNLTVHGVFERFPDLQIYYAETDTGWLPFWLGRIDNMYRKGYNFEYEHQDGLKPLSRAASDMIREHSLWGLTDDLTGVELRHQVGVDKIVWGSDFPHKPTSWPNSRDVFERVFAGVPEGEKAQMLVGNAARFFHLDVASTSEPSPTTEPVTV